MTQPPSGWPSGDPQHGGWQQQPAPAAPGAWSPQPPAPGGWPAQQPSQQAGSGQFGWNAPQPGQAAPGQFGWNAPQPGQPQGPWEPLGAHGYPQPGPKPRGRGKLIASAAVVVALAAGGVTTYIAVSDKNSSGASSPKRAVQSIVSDLNKSDLVGVLDDLAPGERDALAHPTLDTITQLKRLKVLQQNASPNKVSGVSVHAQDLTFAGNTDTINDHVQVVQLTGGTVDVSADASKVPFTRDFLASAFPHGLPQQSSGGARIDIAQTVRDQGGRPVRIATQKVGGTWYPSLFYTIADSAMHGKAPASSDAIPAVGASSPQDAVTRMVNALLQGDLTGAVKLLSPDELAVVHDYGGLLVRNIGSYRASGVTVKDLQVKTEAGSGGATRVLLSSITLADRGGEQTTVKVDGDCADVTAKGQHKRMCTSDSITQVIDALKALGIPLEVTPAQRQAFVDLLSSLTRIGVDTTKSGGQWYVNPVRSFLEITTSVLSGLKDNDLLELFGLFTGIGH